VLEPGAAALVKQRAAVTIRPVSIGDNANEAFIRLYKTFGFRPIVTWRSVG
jgi:hypothetical protein